MTARRLLGWALVAVAAFAGPASAQQEGQRARVGRIDLSGPLPEKPGPFDWLMGDSAPRTLRRTVDQIDAATAENLDALVVRLKDAELSRTQIEELGAALRRVRDAGVRVSVFAEGFGTGELLLGSHADEVIVQSGGPVSLGGMYAEEMFLADTLAWLGVRADMVQIGDYKGAAEQLARNSPSPEWDENITQLLDSLYETMRAQLAAGRRLSEAQLDNAMERGWLATGAEAIRLGLVDREVDLPTLAAHMQGVLGREATWDTSIGESATTSGFDPSNPFAIFQLLSSKPTHAPSGPAIAVLHINGPIVDGDSTEAGLFGGGSVGSRTIRNALEDILAEKNIRGVVVRIDSPGGSATASEIIWQGLRRVAEQKPVWVSVGSMAASGGYYCAVGGDRIYVNPSSIVGSIGVVGGKLAMGGLYDLLKVRVVARARGPQSDLFASTTTWTEEQRGLIRARMQEVYDQFTRRVSAGRPGIDLSRTAEGRLFAGHRAVELKMADQVGGLHDAIADLARHLGLSTYEVLDYPGPKGVDEILEDLLGGGMIRAPGVRAGSGAMLTGEVEALRRVLGPSAWPPVRDALEALMLFRTQPVQLISPRALIVRW